MELTENNIRTPDRNKNTNADKDHSAKELVDLETGLGFLVSILD